MVDDRLDRSSGRISPLALAGKRGRMPRALVASAAVKGHDPLHIIALAPPLARFSLGRPSAEGYPVPTPACSQVLRAAAPDRGRITKLRAQSRPHIANAEFAFRAVR